MFDFRNLAKWFGAGVSKEAGPKLKKCAACGAEFGCGAEAQSCWCQEIETTAELRAELSRKYQGCLCRDCLTKRNDER